jgi:hypothetical protein
LAFTSKYENDKVVGKFFYHSRQVKGLAHDILDDNSLTES